MGGYPMRTFWVRSQSRLALVLMALAFAGAGLASEVQTGLQPVFRQVLTESNAIILPAPAASFDWQPLPGAAGFADSSFALVFGEGTLISVRFTAESQCAGGGTDFGWCAVRILIDGVEAEPAPSDFAFDSSNNGAEGSGSWEGHAMDRHLCIQNPNGVTRIVPVQVEWSEFSNDADFPSFRLDEWSLTIESSAAFGACQPIVLP